MILLFYTNSKYKPHCYHRKKLKRLHLFIYRKNLSDSESKKLLRKTSKYSEIIDELRNKIEPKDIISFLRKSDTTLYYIILCH